MSFAEIRGAYERLMKLHHPDVVPESECRDATQGAAIKSAYQLLMVSSPTIRL